MTTASPIVSRLPGRLRLRAAALRRPAHNRGVCDTLRGWDGVLSVEGNPAAGSVLLRYDVARADPATVEAAVGRLFDSGPAKAPAAGTAAPSLWELNRFAKWGMMASLGGSLAALAVGKKMHAALGAMHVAFLLVHLANHRKRLLD